MHVISLPLRFTIVLIFFFLIKEVGHYSNMLEVNATNCMVMSNCTVADSLYSDWV